MHELLTLLSRFFAAGSRCSTMDRGSSRWSEPCFSRPAMGWGRAGVPALATLIVCAAGCSPGEADMPRGTYVQVEAAGKGLGETSTTTPKILFINPCRGGCFVEPGEDDSITNRSRIPRFPANLPEFHHPDHIWASTMDCVRRLYEPFEIEVTDVDPGNVPHSENMVAGRPDLLGLDSNIGGIAPLGCGGLYGVISFTFPLAQGEPEEIVASLCHTIGQETAHSFGLDHALLCNDPMTYLPFCGDKKFQRIDARCGEMVPRPCLCGQGFQNSHLALLEVLGPRTTPIRFPPLTRIVEPDGESPVFPGFRAHVEASDDEGITQVELSLDGNSLGLRRIPPYVFETSRDLPLGTHTLLAVATNRAGVTAQDRVTFELVEEPARPDAGRHDRGIKVDEPDPIYTRDAGVDAPPVRAIADAGCGCTTAEKSSSAPLWIVLLGGFFFFRKKWLFALLFLIGCEEESRFGDATGELTINPPPPTLLEFTPIILGRESSGRIVLRAKNEGSGVLRLDQPFFEGDGADHFRITIWPQVIAPQKTRDIFLEFSPQGVFSGETTLVIPSSDRDQPEVRYPVKAGAREPCRLRSDRDWVGFKLEQVEAVQFTARGTSDCTVVRYGLDRRLFALVDPPPLPVIVPAGETLTLQIKHIARTTRLGLPVRQFQVEEADGATIVVNLEGQEPVFDCASVFPEKIEFEDGDEGVPQRRRAIVANRCDEDLRILSTAANGLAFKADEMTEPIIVPAHGEASVWATYKPISEIGDNGKLVIRTDDVKQASFLVSLEGKAKIPRPVVLPAIDFGAVTYRQPGGDGRSQCASRTKNIPIFNAGSGGLLIASAIILGDVPAFEIIGADIEGRPVDPSQPFVIPAWSLGHVKVELRPTRRAEAEHFAELILGHSETRQASKINLSGRSAAEVATVTDRFVEPAARPVDLLIVVDDSASMFEAQTRLWNGSQALLPALESPRRPLQIAVTWTDETWPSGGWTNRCSPHPSILPSSYADLATRQDALACALAVGNTSRLPAAGLGAAMRAIEHAVAPPATDGTRNPLMGFMRPDAHLAVLVASDEQDESLESLELLHGFFQGIKGLDRHDLISVHGIIGLEDRSFCDQTSPWVQHGSRYEWMTDRTGGGAHDICANDYRPHFESIAASISARDPHYPLTRAAVPGSVEVFLRGVRVPNDPIDGYFHDATNNLVRLSGASRPAPGDSIEVRYSDLCRP